MTLRHSALVFRRELLDLRRERRVFRRLFVQPFIFLALIAAPALLVQQADARSRSTVFTVAVEGDVAAVPGLAAALDRHPFRLMPSADAARTVTAEKAEVGVIIAAEAPSQVAAGEPVSLQVLAFSTQRVSERARPALMHRLAELGKAESSRLLAEAGASEDLASPVVIDVDDVATTSPEGVRFGIAQAIPALLVIQLFGLVGLTQERIAGAKDKRVLEPLLVLPARRFDLLLGIGAAGMLVGALSAIILFVPVILGVSGIVASLSRSLAGPASVAGALALGASVLAVSFAAIGLLLGARAASGGEGSVFVSMVQLAVMGAALITPFLNEVEGRGAILAVPVLGPMLFVRDGVADGAVPETMVTLVAGQLTVAVVLVRLAARALDGARGVLRLAR